MEEDKFHSEAPAATKDPGYQAQGKKQPFFPAPCREIAYVPSTYKTSWTFYLSTNWKNISAQTFSLGLLLDELRYK